MTADVELLPLPEPDRMGGNDVFGKEFPLFTAEQAEAYADARVAHATAAKDAENEALRAEVGLLRHGNVAYAQQVAELIGRAGSAEARAETLQAEVAHAVAGMNAALDKVIEHRNARHDAEARAERLAEALRYAEAFISVAVPQLARDRDEATNEVLPAIRAALNSTVAQENDDA